MARARSTSSPTVSNSALSQLSHWYFSPCPVSRQTTTSDLPMYLDRLAAAAPASEAAASGCRISLGQQGHLDLRDAILFGILGAIIGNQIGYWIGHRAGRPFVLKWGQYVKLTPERLERLEGLFERHGGKAVFAARFFSISRLLEALIAGMSRMHWGTFLFYSVL